MNDRKRIDELERRVRELEARPVMPTIIIQPFTPQLPTVPFSPPWNPWPPAPLPFAEPIWYVDYSSLPTC